MSIGGRIKVENIKKSELDIYVDFSCECGNAHALWYRNTFPFMGYTYPELNSEYSIEFAIDDILVWNEDIFQNEYIKHSIKVEHEKVILTGYIDSIDNDPEEFEDDEQLTYIRFYGALIRVETVEKPLVIGTPVTAIIESERFILYPYD